MAKRVYFTFDYEDVSDFRANVVRNHKFVDDIETAGYFDASIWEESKKKDAAALKKLISTALDNTSVTVVLIGSDTFNRRWVRYELFKSLERGNKIFGIHINSIAGKDTKTKTPGPNPFEHLGIEFSADGKSYRPVEWDGKKWIFSADCESVAIKERPENERGKIYKLSTWSKTYDWTAEEGHKNFKTWII